MADATGLEADRFDLLEPGLSGPDFIEASGADVLIDAMTTQGLGFDEALREAQAGGFAEAGPLANVRGKDKAIRITTDAMGETIAIGSGKEPLATAAALKDLEHILTARSGGSTYLTGTSA